jgi:thiamine-phosphate pyrophosphorylase
LLGPDRLLGWSVNASEQLSHAQPAQLDYLGVGPIFASQTKPDAAPPIGLAGLAEIAARTTLPIVAIGGVNAQNAGQAITAGAAGVAVVAAICAAEDPERATRELLSQLRLAGRPPAHGV